MTDETTEPLDRPAFSNGFEWEHWSANWCHRCLNDANEDCPLILVALMGQTPREWVQIKPFSLQDRYVCSDFRPLGGHDEEPSPVLGDVTPGDLFKLATEKGWVL